MHFIFKKIPPLAALSLLWLAAILLVNPVGDFPLNDDFSYARTVLNLLTLRKLQYDQWLSMTLVTQVLWGAGFCKLFGFSFTVLRLSTLVLSLAGLAATYQLVRELGQSPKVALLATLILAFNPVFFSLSFTFMTDVPFFAFGAMCTLTYARALRSGTVKWVLWGTAFAVAATFVRQQGLMFPLAFGVAWLFRGGLRPKSVAMAAWPLVLHLVLFLAFSKWLEASQGLPDGYGDFGKLAGRFSLNIFGAMPVRLGVILAYTGGLLLPLVALLWKQTSVGFKTSPTLSSSLLILALLACAAAAWHKLPWGNLVFNLGVGPKLLKDGQFFLNTYPTLPTWGLHLLKILAFAGAFLLLFILKKHLPPKLRNAEGQRPVAVFALANLALYLGFLLLDLHCFDRYFFQLLPFLFICLLPAGGFVLGKRATATCTLLLAGMAALSICTTHDYLAWNRARWEALAHLTQEKNATPNQIDGGFEFNGWHKPGPRNPGGGKSWWWVDQEDYVVAFGNMGGFQKEKGFPFTRWLPPGVDSVFVLRQE